MEAKPRADHKDIDVNEDENRNRLVRAPKYVDTTIFGGWGIKL